MDSNMDIDTAPFTFVVPQPPPEAMSDPIISSIPSPPHISHPTETREQFKAIPVKVHIRRPERDSWVYAGRGVVTLEVSGHSSQVVVRSTSTNKILTLFNETSDLQAEKRGNFVVIGCVEGSKVVSWSLNALNNAETLRLLASIELACYKCQQALGDPRTHYKSRRRIDRVIKDDRRKRHKRRKDQDAMVDAFSRQALSESAEPVPSR